MSKIVRVNNGDFKVVVTNDSIPADAKITLDTGARTGTVVITGNLDVQGTTTTIESNNTTIVDNIIVLNKGEANNYVTLQYSGIQIDRGTNNTYGNAQIVYNENGTGNTDGTVQLKYTIGQTYIPLETDKITTGNSDNDLTLYPGEGVVGVFGTSNYYQRVIDDNSIPNKYYVDYAIEQYFLTHFPGQIQALNTRVTVTETPAPEIGFILNNSTKATINSSGFTIDSQLRLNGSTITNLSAGNNLKLVPSSNGIIELSGYLVLDNKSAAPSATTGANTLYSNGASTAVPPTIGGGDTGLYFVNTTKSDELVSRNRALLWAMLF
jgi:hypothetical protein